MNAQLQPIATEVEEAEFLLTANRSDQGRDEYLTGTLRGFARTFHRARVLAQTGWRVTVDPVDRIGSAQLRVTVEPL